jgi:heptosyltransferase-2
LSNVQVGSPEGRLAAERAGRILVIRGGAIGDFILTLPVLSALRAQLPDAGLEVLGYGHIAQLALAGGLADEVRSIEARPLAAFFARHGKLTLEWQAYFADFAVVISYLYDPDEIFQANVARCSKAQFIAGPHRPDDQAGIHSTDLLLKPLERLAIFDADPMPRLSVHATRTGPHVLALHPGSGSERKNWPETKWSELLADLIRSTTAKLLLVGGEAEGDRLERLSSRLPRERVEQARNLPLVELAGRLANCSAFVGHDSGITHLAAALGLPGLALWGETAEAVWAPRSPRIRLVRAGAGLRELPVETVRRELEEMPGLKRS